MIKNDLGGGVLPSKYSGANSAWVRLAGISHNVLTALKPPALPSQLLTARPRRLQFLIFNTPGGAGGVDCRLPGGRLLLPT